MKAGVPEAPQKTFFWIPSFNFMIKNSLKKNAFLASLYL